MDPWCRCQKCSFRWVSRKMAESGKKPISCPKCKRVDWDVKE